MDRKRSGETILTITVALILIYVIREMRDDWMIYAALVFGGIGVLWKWFRYQVHAFWFWLADKVGFVVSRIVLSLVFLVVVVPFGLVSRLFRKDLMMMKKGGSTYFRTRNHTYKKEDMRDPW
jgi:hypothetical protein